MKKLLTFLTLFSFCSFLFASTKGEVKSLKSNFVLGTPAIQLFNDGQKYTGSITLSKSESEWRFIPVEPWIPGNYEVIVETRLEDLAGNNMNRLFDGDLESDVEDSKENQIHEIAFVVAEGSMP
jgi:hypothetical protein